MFLFIAQDGAPAPDTPAPGRLKSNERPHDGASVELSFAELYSSDAEISLKRPVQAALLAATEGAGAQGADTPNGSKDDLAEAPAPTETPIGPDAGPTGDVDIAIAVADELDVPSKRPLLESKEAVLFRGVELKSDAAEREMSPIVTNQIIPRADTAVTSATVEGKVEGLLSGQAPRDGISSGLGGRSTPPGAVRLRRDEPVVSLPPAGEAKALPSSSSQSADLPARPKAEIAYVDLRKTSEKPLVSGRANIAVQVPEAATSGRASDSGMNQVPLRNPPPYAPYGPLPPGPILPDGAPAEQSELPPDVRPLRVSDPQIGLTTGSREVTAPPRQMAAIPGASSTQPGISIASDSQANVAEMRTAFPAEVSERPLVQPASNTAATTPLAGQAAVSQMGSQKTVSGKGGSEEPELRSRVTENVVAATEVSKAPPPQTLAPQTLPSVAQVTAQRTALAPRFSADPLIAEDDRALALSEAEITFGAGPVTDGRSAGGPAPSNAAQVAQGAAGQIVRAAVESGGAKTELVLDPKELGKVRLQMVSEDRTISLHLIAERPETLELMRRHIEVLEQEFRDLGFDDVRFSFGDRETSEDQSDPDLDAAPPTDTPLIDVDGAPSQMRPRMASDGQLDIRL